jgi:hypothetical protein
MGVTRLHGGFVQLQERMSFLQEDLMHLFDDQGIDEKQ